MQKCIVKGRLAHRHTSEKPCSQMLDTLSKNLA